MNEIYNGIYYSMTKEAGPRWEAIKNTTRQFFGKPQEGSRREVFDAMISPLSVPGGVANIAGARKGARRTLDETFQYYTTPKNKENAFINLKDDIAGGYAIKDIIPEEVIGALPHAKSYGDLEKYLRAQEYTRGALQLGSGLVLPTGIVGAGLGAKKMFFD